MYSAYGGVGFGFLRGLCLLLLLRSLRESPQVSRVGSTSLEMFLLVQRRTREEYVGGNHLSCDCKGGHTVCSCGKRATFGGTSS